MIGFYDYTVVLTYISFLSAVAGIFCASSSHLNWAVFCLAFSGLCDMFDGKIAARRMRKASVFRSIPSAMWSALGCFPL